MAGVRSKRRSSGKYQGWYTGYTGERKWFDGTHSRAETLRIAQRLEDEHRQIRLGYAPIPSDRHQYRTFSEAKDEYLAWGKAQGGRDGRPWGPTHLRNRKSQLTWWYEQLGVTLDDIRLASVEACLRGIQEGRTPKTVANYAETIAAFCDWCVERGYLIDDPLKDLRPLDTTPQSHRRAMTVEEITRLLECCAPFHRLLLETAFVTGLRANELRNLTVHHLDVQRCGLHLDAAWTKNRKPGFQPLPFSLRERLQSFSGQARALYEKHYGAQLAMSSIPEHPLLYVPSHPARSLDGDLATAGIPKVTPAGKLDFHAVRLAYINLVIESGVTVKEAQALARHATPQLTMNVYGRAREERLWNAVEQVAHTIRVTSVSEADNSGAGDSSKTLISHAIPAREFSTDAGSIPAASIGCAEL